MNFLTVQFHIIAKGLLVLVLLVWSVGFFVKLVGHTENLKLIDFAINRSEFVTETMMSNEEGDLLAEKWVSSEKLDYLVSNDGWEVIAVDPLADTLKIKNYRFQSFTPVDAKKMVVDLLSEDKRLVLVSNYQNYYSLLLMQTLKDSRVDISNVFIFDSETGYFVNEKKEIDLLTSSDMKKLSYDRETSFFIDPRAKRLKIDTQFIETYHMPIDEALNVSVSTLNQRPIIVASFGMFSYIDSLGLVRRLEKLGVVSVKGIFVTPENWENPIRDVE